MPSIPSEITHRNNLVVLRGLYVAVLKRNRGSIVIINLLLGVLNATLVAMAFLLSPANLLERNIAYSMDLLLVIFFGAWVINTTARASFDTVISPRRMKLYPLSKPRYFGTVFFVLLTDSRILVYLLPFFVIAVYTICNNTDSLLRLTLLFSLMLLMENTLISYLLIVITRTAEKFGKIVSQTLPMLFLIMVFLFLRIGIISSVIKSMYSLALNLLKIGY